MSQSYIVRMPFDKNFGFIKGLGGDEDYFFHADDLKSDFKKLRAEFHLRKDQIKVDFDVVPSEKGMRAGNVRLL